jgi:hypothetical protein
MWNGELLCSIFLIHMSRPSIFADRRSSKLFESLKKSVICPIRSENRVMPKNSRTMENPYSIGEEPAKSPYPTVVITSKIQ